MHEWDAYFLNILRQFFLPSLFILLKIAIIAGKGTLSGSHYFIAADEVCANEVSLHTTVLAILFRVQFRHVSLVC